MHLLHRKWLQSLYNIREDASKIDSYYADAMLAGIMLDTKNFVMRTGVRTFEAAAFLRKLGADTVAVRGLFSNSIEAYQSKQELSHLLKFIDAVQLHLAIFKQKM